MTPETTTVIGSFFEIYIKVFVTYYSMDNLLTHYRITFSSTNSISKQSIGLTTTLDKEKKVL